MSRKEEEIRIVDDLSKGMKLKLRLNSHKPHWSRSDTIESLVGKLFIEAAELHAASREHILGETPDTGTDLYWECCDVANLAAMIADGLKPTKED